MSGHGGERWIERAPVDGYNPETKTVFQYHGCYWHGCRKCFPYDRERIIDHKDKTREDLFKATKRRIGYLRKAGYRVVEAWACEVWEILDELPRTQTKSYPHAILYDFEAYGDNNQRKEPTPTLTIENAHVPISVSIGDTLKREPTHICEIDPAELVRKFMEELERLGKNIRAQVRAEFMLTCGFRFLDIINYLGPGTSYEKWVKAYECKTVKSWFPYEWFDRPKKLDYPGLSVYVAWYSRLKNAFVLKLSEWRARKKLLRENGMKTFADGLRYYNNLDVAPGLEALQKMRNFYTEKGIDILKDAVSVPGVSLHYLLRGAVERNAELYSPGKEAYDMLKEAVVGGPSLVFTRLHEFGVTEIRSHQIPEPRLCKNILGYDANALYLEAVLLKQSGAG